MTYRRAPGSPLNARQIVTPQRTMVCLPESSRYKENPGAPSEHFWIRRTRPLEILRTRPRSDASYLEKGWGKLLQRSVNVHGLDVIQEVLLLTRLRVRYDTELDSRAVVVVPLVLLLVLEDEEQDTLRDLLNPD